MEVAFIIIAILTLASAVCAMTFRNLVHCALFLVLTFGGLAAFYLQLAAEFVGLVQILVYIGAVAILIVFAILLTRGGRPETEVCATTTSRTAGLAVSLLVGGSLLACVLNSPALHRPMAADAPVSVRQIGWELMTTFVLPLEVIALLLTAAMIGAAIIALREPGPARAKPNEG